MNAGTRPIVKEGRWAIAGLACLVMPVLGMVAGFVLTAGVVTWRLGNDVDGAMNVFFLGPIGALAGLGAGVFVASRTVYWARGSKVRR